MKHTQSLSDRLFDKAAKQMAPTIRVDDSGTPYKLKKPALLGLAGSMRRFGIFGG